MIILSTERVGGGDRKPPREITPTTEGFRPVNLKKKKITGGGEKKAAKRNRVLGGPQKKGVLGGGGKGGNDQCHVGKKDLRSSFMYKGGKKGEGSQWRRKWFLGRGGKSHPSIKEKDNEGTGGGRATLH